ncbi:7-carboxy-7-deazaguanine synthase QueE [Hydrogenobaculum acidophilum]
MINEIFYSLQGEGFLIGTPALFVRFQGCNLRCVWCDEKNALDFDKIGKSYNIAIEEIKHMLSLHNPSLIVLTGGEPLLNEDFIHIFSYLKSLSKTIQIETNATILREDIYDAIKSYPHTYITLSPKYISNYAVDQKFLAFNKNIELKIVVDEHLNESILEREYIKHFVDKGLLILQPLWEEGKVKFLDKATSLAEKFGGRVIPQVHKLLGLK